MKYKSYTLTLMLTAGLMSGCLDDDSSSSSTNCQQTICGAGTGIDPYRIYTLDQLNEIRNLERNAYFRLEQDIDASATASWDSGKGWSPIGTFSSGDRFTGHFNGNGHEIKNLVINRPETDSVGLFSTGYGAEFSNLTLVDIDITGQSSTGSLVGRCSDSTAFAGCTIKNVSAEGKLTSSGDFTGGIVGGHLGSSVVLQNSHSEITIETSGRHAGGLIGYAAKSRSLIAKSAAIVEITQTNDSSAAGAGGLIGSMNDGVEITESFAKGNISSSGGSVGGIAGWESSPTNSIKKSYSRVSLSGTNYLGGIVGYRDASNIEKTYSASSIHSTAASTDNRIGGIKGTSPGSLLASNYWNHDLLGDGTQVNQGDAVSLKASEMKEASNFPLFDFENVWAIDPDINDGYPFLQHANFFQ